MPEEIVVRHRRYLSSPVQCSKEPRLAWCHEMEFTIAQSVLESAMLLLVIMSSEIRSITFTQALRILQNGHAISAIERSLDCRSGQAFNRNAGHNSLAVC